MSVDAPPQDTYYIGRRSRMDLGVKCVYHQYVRVLGSVTCNIVPCFDNNSFTELNSKNSPLPLSNIIPLSIACSMCINRPTCRTDSMSSAYLTRTLCDTFRSPLARLEWLIIALGCLVSVSLLFQAVPGDDVSGTQVRTMEK